MSIKVMTQVWENSRQKGSALLILIAIADFADDDGYAFPAVKTLARKARMSESNVHYVLRKLRESGELSIEQGQGRRGSNLYRVQTLDPATDSRGASGNRGGVLPIAPKPSLEPSLSKSSSVQDSIESFTPEDLPRTREKKPTQTSPSVSPEFRLSMIEKYASQSDAVSDVIDLALSHVNAKKYADTEQYVANWLRREFASSYRSAPVPESRNGQPAPPGMPSNYWKLKADKEREDHARERAKANGITRDDSEPPSEYVRGTTQ